MSRTCGVTSSRAHAPTIDVQLVGTVFVDLVFADLAGPPVPGREMRTTSIGFSPGGTANLAVALRRLGLTVRLDAAFATDLYADFLWRTLVHEGVDLSGSARLEDWSTPLTVSLAYAGDRSMITYERPQPAWAAGARGAECPPPRAVFADLGRGTPSWLPQLHAAGARTFADVSWDDTERWAGRVLDELVDVDVFMPNCVEAMAYTRTDSPEAAARALIRRVPLVAVKCGPDGALAMRAGDDEVVREPAIEVVAVDPTGAGDVFDAAFILGSLASWTLPETLRFANLCAGLSVLHHGGSLSAPTMGEVAAWIAADPERAARFRFLRPLIRRVREREAPQRAHQTLHQ